MVQALAPDAAQEPLANGIRFGSAHRRAQHFNGAPCSHACELLSMPVIVVADQETRFLTIGRRFPQLLRHPALP
jgi:hypothetical protein